MMMHGETSRDPSRLERAEKLRRGKLLLKLRETLIHVKIDDEGDRVYLRSTNDAEVLKEIIEEIDEYGWQEFMREKGDPDIDIFETCRKAVMDRQRLEQALMMAKAHLGACLLQQIDTDDKIIMDHIREAHALAEQALKP